MTATATSSSARADALRCFGYSKAEASFLALAAAHGGYFLRRQAAQFLERKDGSVVTQLVQRALDLEHARSSAWRQGTLLYHLCARPFYEALGEPDNRNRRQHELAQITNRVMSLDYVLAHRDVRFLATERDKLAHFDGLGIARARLPQKRFIARVGDTSTTRYFVDRSPISVRDAASDLIDAHPVFAFLDEGLVTLSRFERYLGEYRRLFESLVGFRLVYVAATPRHFAGARALFERERTRLATPNAPLSDSLDDTLRTYFELRKRFEDRDFASFDRQQLLLLRDRKDAFSSPDVEARYRIWRASATPTVSLPHEGNSTPAASFVGTFATELLTHDYSLFGHFVRA